LEQPAIQVGCHIVLRKHSLLLLSQQQLFTRVQFDELFDFPSSGSSHGALLTFLERPFLKPLTIPAIAFPASGLRIFRNARKTIFFFMMDVLYVASSID
jgi:hypothetical protein